MNRVEEDVEAKAVPAAITPLRATLFAVAGLAAAMLILAAAMLRG